MNRYPRIPDNILLKTNEPIISEVQDEFIDFYEYCKDNRKIFKAVPAYYEMKLPGSVDRTYMRSRTANMILEAAGYLPEGLCFRIYDAWRPFQVQEELFNNYMDRLSVLPENQGKSQEQLHELTTTFVSYPSRDPDKPYVHSTGGAVDLTIVDEAGYELDMGTKFDDFTEKANTAYYEIHSADSSVDSEFETIRNNRRLLYHIMTKVGFTNLPSEWWHYDYGDQFWSSFQHKPALYQGVLFAEDLFDEASTTVG